MTDVDCVVETQAAYIENLLQQIYVLENEIGYLYPSKIIFPVLRGEKILLFVFVAFIFFLLRETTLFFFFNLFLFMK